MKTRKVSLLFIPAFFLLVAVMIFVNLPKDSLPAVGADPGENIPDFTVSCLDGGVFTLSEHRGKVVIINFWATWCTPCVNELPSFDRLQSEHPDDAVVLAIHTPPVNSDVEEFLSAYSYGIRFAVDEDGSLSAALNASEVLPQTVVIDRWGVVTYNLVGAMDYEKLSELFNAANQS